MKRCPICKKRVYKLSPNAKVCWSCFDTMTLQEWDVVHALHRSVKEAQTARSLFFHSIRTRNKQKEVA